MIFQSRFDFKANYLKPWHIAACTFGILFLRTINSFEKFPADPGYDYLLLATLNGASSWFELDPYLHFGAHVLSWLASFAPLNNQAIFLSLLVNAVWSLVTAAIFSILRNDGLAPVVALLSALTLPFCPAAAESSLANVGNLKWPMLILALVAASSKQITRSPILLSQYFLITGLTNPLTSIVFLPLLINYNKCNKNDRKKFTLPIVSLLTSFGIQAIIVGRTGLTSGSNIDKTYGPWTGMGVFWWAGLIGPSIVSLGVLFICFRFKSTFSSPLLIRLASSALVLAVISYFYGGIADRYFVTPMVMSWISVICLISIILQKKTRQFKTLVISIASLMFAIPTVYWFDAMWFLTAGPKWSEQVSLARSTCKEKTENATLYIGDGSIELPCSYILNN
jgi:hypothetical protein